LEKTRAGFLCKKTGGQKELDENIDAREDSNCPSKAGAKNWARRVRPVASKANGGLFNGKESDRQQRPTFEPVLMLKSLCGGSRVLWGEQQELERTFGGRLKGGERKPGGGGGKVVY